MNNNESNLCICGKHRKLVKNCKTVYIKTCGEVQCLVSLRKNTNKEKYGVEHALQSPIIIKGMKEKLIEKHGVDNVSYLDEVKKKKIETCMVNFGVEHPMQSDKVQEKSRQQVFKDYGVYNISQAEIIIKKIQQAFNEISPETGMSVRQMASKKRKEYFMTNFGVEYYFQTDEFKEKYKKEMLKKYGVDNLFKSEFFKNDMIERGFIKDDETIEKFDNYERIVRNMTAKVFRENYDFLCDAYLRGNNYHLDHIFSVSEGFKENIEPEIIASIVNLQIIPKNINMTKNAKSWITKNELLERYQKLKDNPDFYK